MTQGLSSPEAELKHFQRQFMAKDDKYMNVRTIVLITVLITIVFARLRNCEIDTFIIYASIFPNS